MNAGNNNAGILPIPPIPFDTPMYLKADGTWGEWLVPPVVEHEELHTDNGAYDE